MKNSGVFRQQAAGHQGLVLEYEDVQTWGCTDGGPKDQEMTEGQTPFSPSCLKDGASPTTAVPTSPIPE